MRRLTIVRSVGWALMFMVSEPIPHGLPAPPLSPAGDLWQNQGGKEPAGTSTQTQTVPLTPLSLDACLDLAWENAISRIVVEKQIALGMTRRDEAFRQLMPTGSIHWEERGGTLSTSTEDFEGREIIGELQYPIWDSFRSWNTFKQSKLNLHVARLDVERIRQDLILEVREAYLNLARAEEDVAKFRALQHEAAQVSEISAKRFELGLSRRVDRLAVEALVKQIASRVESLEQARMVARLTLAQRLGLARDADVTIQPVQPTYRPLDVAMDQLIDTGLSSRPALRLNELSVQVSEYQVKIAKSASSFQVDLTASAGQAREVFKSASLDLDDEWFVGVRVTRPFWGSTVENNYVTQQRSPTLGQDTRTDSNSNRITLSLLDQYPTDEKEAEVALAQARDELDRATKDTLLEIQESVSDLRSAEARIIDVLVEIEHAGAEERVTKARMNLDEASLSDWLGAKLRLWNAHSAHLQVLFDHHLAGARLNRAVGVPDYILGPVEDTTS